MTVDFATLAVGDDVAWVRSDGPRRPWAPVRFGVVRKVLKTRVVVRFGSENVAWSSPYKRYGAPKRSRWDFGPNEQLVTADEGRRVADTVRGQIALATRVTDADLGALAVVINALENRRAFTADDLRKAASALRRAAYVLDSEL